MAAVAPTGSVSCHVLHLWFCYYLESLEKQPTEDIWKKNQLAYQSVQCVCAASADGRVSTQ